MELFIKWYEFCQGIFNGTLQSVCGLFGYDLVPRVVEFYDNPWYMLVVFILSSASLVPIIIYCLLGVTSKLVCYVQSLKSRAQKRAASVADTSNADLGTLVVTKMGDHIFSPKTSDEVLAAHKELILKLKTHIDFVGDSFEMVAMPMLERLASLCGSLPASEFNHDHGEYGLFRHSLEVAIEALEPNSKDFSYYKASRCEKSDKPYSRYKNPCSGLALMFAAFSHDLSKLYTDYQVLSDNGTVYDPRCMDMNDFIELTHTKTLSVSFNKSRAHRHDLGVAQRSALLLTDYPLAYFLTTGFTYPPTADEFSSRQKYELYEQEKDGELNDTLAKSAKDDSIKDADSLDNEIKNLKKKRVKDLSIDEQEHLSNLQELKLKREEIAHFATPNHWSNAEVAALLDGSHPLWAIVAKADSFCSFCSNVTRNNHQYLPSYLVAYMIYLLKDQAHLVNNFYSDIFLVPQGIFLRKGSIELKALSQKVKELKGDNKQDWLTTLRSINVIHMASNMRTYSWGQLECEEQVFFELGLIVKVNLPQMLLDAFPAINFIERGFNPPELAHIDWEKLQITRCDTNAKGEVVASTLHSDEIRPPVFFERYHCTASDYVKNLGIDDSELNDVMKKFVSFADTDPKDFAPAGEFSDDEIKSCDKAVVQAQVQQKISSGEGRIDSKSSAKEHAIADKSYIEDSVAADLERVKDKKKSSCKKPKIKAQGNGTASVAKAKKTSVKSSSSKSKATKTLKKTAKDKATEDKALVDEKKSVMAGDTAAIASTYEDLSYSLYQTLQLMCNKGLSVNSSQEKMQLDSKQKLKLDAMLPMFMSLLANASPEALSQSLKENFGIVADQEQLAQHAQLLLSNVIEHGGESATLDDDPVKDVRT